MSENSPTRESADDLVYRFRRERPTRRLGLVVLAGLLFAWRGGAAGRQGAVAGHGGRGGQHGERQEH